MDKELIKEMINRTDLIVDPGIEEDVKGFFRGDTTVKKYHLKEEPNKIYKLEIYLENPTKYEQEKIFFSFIMFMKYPGVNSFFKDDDKYIYLSLRNNLRGFCFEVEFGN